jgi:hypothetical protein
MKNYPNLNDLENRRKTQEQLDVLISFQEMLRSSEALDAQFCGKSSEIAAGLQPWIDALT